MSKTINRRSVLKLFPAVAVIPAVLTSNSMMYGCAPKVTNKSDSIFVSTWNNAKANNEAAKSAKEGKNVIVQHTVDKTLTGKLQVRN